MWKNLFRHYILCLLHTVGLTQIMGDDFRPEQAVPLLHWTPSVAPDPMKEHHAQICSKFFSEKGFEEFLILLASLKRKVRREELAFYLTSLHAIALRHVISQLMTGDLLRRIEIPPVPDWLTETTIANLQKMLMGHDAQTPDSEQIAAILFDNGSRSFHQLALLQLVNHSEPPNQGWRFISFEFPEFYCKKIAIILYPPWYAACFVRSATHAAMWAHYGNRHEGVCLKFRAQNNIAGGSELTLQGVIGTSSGHQGRSEHRGERKFKLTRINYTNSFPEIDFFRSLGRFSIPVLNRDWYSDERELSENARTIFLDEDGWRARYWNNLELISSTKFDDWKEENEYRLVVTGLVNALPLSHRVYTYRFSDLEGVIFGINTPLDDKLKIMKIIERKCIASRRTEFKFLQASYSSGTKRIDVHHLRLLNFKMP